MGGLAFLGLLTAGAFIFSFAGVIVLLSKTSRQEKNIQELRRRLDALHEKRSEAPAAEKYTHAVEYAAVTGKTAPNTSAIFEPASEPAAPVPEKEASAVQVPSKPAEQSRPHGAFLSFIKGGNLWAAGGVVLLTAGFGTLIAYLGRRGFFTVEMGIAAAAAAGLGMILSGWRLRLKRPVFFLILQGGGVGLLYMSIFAAHKLTVYFGAPLSLVLMTVLIPPTVILALFQNSQGLAVFGFMGGFSAPLLLASGAGNHLFLFAYYTILNAGVLAIGFFRTWKGLNLAAFLFSFGFSIFWAMRYYAPEFFFTSEPFFIVFIILFTVLGLRSFRSPSLFWDLILIAGTPVAAVILQWKVFSYIEHGYAIIAITFSAFYLMLTIAILKKFPARKICAEGYLALGAVLANLAIPLELSPGITGAIWAAEGALIFFLGLRVFSRGQGDKRIMAAGLVIHAAAAIAFIRDIYSKWHLDGIAEWRSPAFLGSIVIALSALAMAALAEKLMGKREGKKYNPLAWAVALWGFGWWFCGWGFEFNRILVEPAGAFLLLASASAFTAFLALKISGLDFFAAAMVPAPLIAIFTVLGVLGNNISKFSSYRTELVFTHNFFDPSRITGWLSFLIFHSLMLALPALLQYLPSGYGRINAVIKNNSEKTAIPAWFHDLRTFVFLLTALALISASGRFYTIELGLSPSWTSLAGLLPLFAFLIILSQNRSQRKKPVDGGTALIHTALPVIVSFILALWFIVTLLRPGDPSPLPFYVPVLNPLDLLEGLCIACIVYWQIKRDPAMKSLKKTDLIIIGDVMVFLWITSILARSIHFYAGIPWHMVSSSDAFNVGLFIFWALYGILHIITGHRKKSRPPWIAGAILVVADIAKLILLDMRDIGAIPRILSFFAAGIVLLFIGWAAPLPPAAKTSSGEASQ